jgi:hypothetical protein
MTTEDDGFTLAAMIPAADLARLRRRVAFLEAALVQVLRDEGALREWFTAGELAALALPGLPATASGIARMARRERWEARITMGRGGERSVYHFSALPRAAFAELLARVIRAGAGPDGLPEAEAGRIAAPALAPPLHRPAPLAANATPQWVLPLLRLLRGGVPDLDQAVAELGQALAPDVPLPSVAEARDMLRALGLLAS